jgi:hypothetical protein
MTAEQVVAHIEGLLRITRETGMLTRRTQAEFLQSLPDNLLLEAAPKLKEVFDREKAVRAARHEFIGGGAAK